MVEARSSVDTSDAFLRIWAAFDAGQILSACAWCGRVCIDETWLLPSLAAIAAVDKRHTFSHSICDRCATAYAPARENRPAETYVVAGEAQMATAPNAPSATALGFGGVTAPASRET